MCDYVERNRLGEMLPDVDVLFATGQFLRPDLVFIENDRRDGISDRGIAVAPGLNVEVQSPTSGSIDRMKQPRRYGEIGVPEYWVADSRPPPESTSPDRVPGHPPVCICLPVQTVEVGSRPGNKPGHTIRIYDEFTGTPLQGTRIAPLSHL
jgi:Uma2 family endonuclease